MGSIFFPVNRIGKRVNCPGAVDRPVTLENQAYQIILSLSRPSISSR